MPAKPSTALLDARDFRWRALRAARTSVFDQFVASDAPKPRSVGEVRFDEHTFEQVDYDVNGVRFSFYSGGTIDEYAAVRLDNGHVLFCVVRGKQFAGTFDSADDIRMEYYDLTPLEPTDAPE